MGGQGGEAQEGGGLKRAGKYARNKTTYRSARGISSNVSEFCNEFPSLFLNSPVISGNSKNIFLLVIRGSAARAGAGDKDLREWTREQGCKCELNMGGLRGAGGGGGGSN